MKYLVDEFKITKEDLLKEDRHGKTPLHNAASRGKKDLMKYLVDEFKITKEDLLKEDGLGKTPFYRAALGLNKELTIYVATIILKGILGEEHNEITNSLHEIINKAGELELNNNTLQLLCKEFDKYPIFKDGLPNDKWLSQRVRQTRRQDVTGRNLETLGLSYELSCLASSFVGTENTGVPINRSATDDLPSVVRTYTRARDASALLDASAPMQSNGARTCVVL